jgi:hypothetical protein
LVDDDFGLKFVLAVLATWRVSHLLANEDGPFDIIVRIRATLGEGLLGGLMDCFKCLSLWVAAPIALFLTHTPWVWTVSWLALSGGACLLERFGKTAPFAAIGPDPIRAGEDHALR